MAKKSGKTKKIIISLVVVIIGAVIAANVLRKPDKGTEVQTEKVKRGTVIQTVTASGKIRPVVEVKMSAKVSGNIIKLSVEEGDSVHKGDLLLKLDQEKYLAVRERAESMLKSSKASLWKAEADYTRMKELNKQMLASEAELQSAEASLLLAEAQVEQQQASLKEILDDLSKTEIYSPMEGVVSQLNKELGEMALGASFQEDVIMVIADLRNMEAEVEVDENDVVSVSEGDPVEIEIDAFPDTLFQGKVTRIANSAVTRGFGTQDQITNFIVEIKIRDKIQGVRPGMSCTVDIEVEKHEDVLYLPIQCVAMREPQKADENEEGETSEMTEEDADEEEMIEVVFMVDEADTARMAAVSTGITSDTDIEIVSGVEEEMRIISGPYRVLANKLQDGDLVKEEDTKKKGNDTGDNEGGH